MTGQILPELFLMILVRGRFDFCVGLMRRFCQGMVCNADYLSKIVDVRNLDILCILKAWSSQVLRPLSGYVTDITHCSFFCK